MKTVQKCLTLEFHEYETFMVIFKPSDFGVMFARRRSEKGKDRRGVCRSPRSLASEALEVASLWRKTFEDLLMSHLLKRSKAFNVRVTAIFLSILLKYHLGTNWALDFEHRVILSFRSTISTLSFSWKIKYFTEQNIFYRLGILHDFSISSFYS